MKFISYKTGEVSHIGIISKDGNNIININRSLNKNYRSMNEFIAFHKEEEISRLQQVYENNSSFDAVLSKVKLSAPIEKPLHDIICVGLNYKAHIAEGNRGLNTPESDPKACVYFAKRAIHITGPEEEIESRFDIDENLDYEAELAIIIGKTGKNIPRESVYDYIFGYSVFNDFSSRKIQRGHIQWLRGKSLDSYSAMGPCIVHKSALPFPLSLNVKSYVNGEIRQSSNTSLLIYGIDHIISEFSNGITLEAGDIIATGTPAGTGMGFTPPKYLKKGDIVECEISQIGTLKNTIK
jgi:2-keto-4-pentenoate hydratase/2-oxohepta-3-ene-1,7-dioic acid hydratase in catechol pathway